MATLFHLHAAKAGSRAKFLREKSYPSDVRISEIVGCPECIFLIFVGEVRNLLRTLDLDRLILRDLVRVPVSHIYLLS